MIEEKVKSLLKEIPATNPFGEKVTLVAAVKLQTAEHINRAICGGVTDIGDNHVQEFRDKFNEIKGNPRRHFIGHLQTNKIKYLLGKVDLYHSVDRYNLAEELSRKSAQAGVTSNILIQINIGNEETKGGFALEESEEVFNKISALPALNVEGLMAMLPFDRDQALLRRLAKAMREKYDGLNAKGANFKYLSMGMSGDWKLCVEEGSNMIRLGTSIFGQRNYQKT
ncbi:MAG: YggS family pyridoxal phosphate-dependent enzyme [Clostridia bacterium]|nr:YggS family pyridoxal phosphate-dependent enzyme [Clostridia bacterium]